MTWTTHALPSVGAWYGAAAGNGAVVAVGGANADKVAVSLNGAAFVEYDTGIGSGQPLRVIVFGNDRFVAFGTGGNCATSVNGTDWTVYALPYEQTATGAVWTGTEFVLVTDGTWVYKSATGASWTEHGAVAGGGGTYWGGLTFGAGYVRAIRNTGGGVVASADAVSWGTEEALPYTGIGGPRAIAHDGTQAFASAWNESSVIIETAGAWQEGPFDDVPFWAVGTGSAKLIAAGYGRVFAAWGSGYGDIAESDDGFVSHTVHAPQSEAGWMPQGLVTETFFLGFLVSSGTAYKYTFGPAGFWTGLVNCEVTE